MQYQIKIFSILPLAKTPSCQEKSGPDPSQGLSATGRMQAGGPEMPLHKQEQGRDTLSHICGTRKLSEWPMAEEVPCTLGEAGS